MNRFAVNFVVGNSREIVFRISCCLLLQKYISGWGPGGQCVNTSQNAVMLKHIPTGIVVKVHDSRLLQKNIQIAFER